MTARPSVRRVKRVKRGFVLAFALLLAAGCKRGSARGARLIGERVPAAVAAIAHVPKEQVTFKVEDEPFSEVWYVTADTKDGKPWRCFFDRDAEWCDHGEGTILAKVIEHRRLGSNRGSLDDPTWLLLVREAYGVGAAFPEKGFPPQSDAVRARLRPPLATRPEPGGYQLDVDAIDVNGQLVHVRLVVTEENVTTVTFTPITG